MSAVRDRFYEEFDGAPADGVRYQDQVTFDTEYFDPRTNAAEHFLGSYSVEMQVDGNEVAVTIRNRTSMNSFAAGTPIRAINDATGWSIPQAESYERNGEARPGGNIHQTIRWREPLEESD